MMNNTREEQPPEVEVFLCLVGVWARMWWLQSLARLLSACGMHQTIDSSQTHGMQPDSEDSTPSAGLYVRLLTSVNFLHINYLSSLFFSLFILLKALKG